MTDIEPITLRLLELRARVALDDLGTPLDSADGGLFCLLSHAHNDKCMLTLLVTMTCCLDPLEWA